jgi:hypothetical protein
MAYAKSGVNDLTSREQIRAGLCELHIGAPLVQPHPPGRTDTAPPTTGSATGHLDGDGRQR